MSFFRAEYALNARIAEYPKPIVVLADGITMGGGIGLAGHAAVRVVTERSKLAMPETRIGFTPDVGGTWLLGRAPGRLGEYLALTGATMDAADAVYAGFADHVVPSAHLGRSARSPADPRRSRRRRTRSSCSSTRRPNRPRSPHSATGSTTRSRPTRSPSIVDRLRARPEPAASATADLLEELSPTALAVTLEAVRRARGLPDLRAALAQEYGLVLWFATTQPDLHRGHPGAARRQGPQPALAAEDVAELSPDAAASAFAYEPTTPLWS